MTRSASPDNMNALEASETSDSGPTVAETEKKGNDLAGGRKESKVVSLADDREAGEGEEGRTARRRSRQGTRDTTRSENPSLARRFTDLFVSEHPIKHEPTWRASALAIVKASWLNILLVFIPVSSPNYHVLATKLIVSNSTDWMGGALRPSQRHHCLHLQVSISSHLCADQS